jgi:hypothetical protein
MKAVYFRNTDWRDYLIPAEFITHFDSDNEALQEAECGDDADYFEEVCRQFDEKYEEYVVEGELKTIRFWIDEE